MTDIPTEETELGKLEAILNRIDQAQSMLNRTPCERQPNLCLEPVEGEGSGWGDMNPNRMCPTCAAYWHLAMAVNLLQHHKRVQELIAVAGQKDHPMDDHEIDGKNEGGDRG